MLQEILDKKEETSTSNNSNSNNNNDLITVDSSGVIVIDSADNSNAAVPKDINDVCLVDIPMPNVAENETADSKIGIDSVDNVPKEPLASNASPLKPETDNPEVKSATSNNTVMNATTAPTESSATNNVSSAAEPKQSKASPVPLQPIPIIKATYTINKPKSLTKLPMPPGVNVAELEDITTPSPPRSASPISKPAAAKTNSTAPNEALTPATAKKGLLNLPMPPVIPGSEDLSGDDDYISSPNPTRKPLSANSSNKKEVKRKRPVILNRRNSRSQAIKDWGERCVDVFEVIAQIGEGTYGQVS